MKEEFEDVFHEEEYDELLNRWEDMLKNKKKYFFDVFEFENIIDYYIDIDKANNALNAINLASEQHPSSINIQLKKAQVLVEKGLSNQALKIIDNIELIESSNTMESEEQKMKEPVVQSVFSSIEETGYTNV